ncbi:MAG: hypothetical protein ACLVGL_15065 [Waltera sp.]
MITIQSHEILAKPRRMLAFVRRLDNISLRAASDEQTTSELVVQESIGDAILQNEALNSYEKTW